MRVLLILPPNAERFEIFNKRLSKFYFDEANVTPPLGLAYIAAMLEKQGDTVEILDINAEHFSDEKFLLEILKFNPDIIGLSVLTHTFPYAIRYAKLLKQEFPNIPIIFGGRHVELYPNDLLTFPEIDYGIIGDGEIPTAKLITLLKRFNQKLDSNEYYEEINKIEGLIYRNKNGKIIINPVKNLLKDLDQLPLPSRHLFKKHLYKTFFSDEHRPSTSMITSRDCPFQCNYCAEKFSIYRSRSVENVMKEIKEIYHKYGIRDIIFNDSTFSVNKKWTLKFCQAIIDEGLDLRFYIRTRVDCVNPEILRALAHAGCVRINYGFESGNQKILNNLGKNVSLERMRQAVKWTKEAGIPIWGFFMIGNPGDTIETIKDTINFAKELDLDFAQFSRLNPFPGTEIYFDYLAKGGRDVWRDYIYGKTKNKNISLPNASLTIEELDKWVEKAYRKYYYRPKMIFKKIREINSITMLLRYIKAALAIL